MTPKELTSIKIGDVVYAVTNGGTTGISQYQYIGVFTSHETKEVQHVFLSPYFVSTICILKGREESSRRIKDLHLTKEGAIQRHKEVQTSDCS